MSSYGDDSPPAPAQAPAPKQKRASTKMTDKQKADLNKHMKKTGLTGSEAKSHRMKMMSKMRQGRSVAKAHKEIMGSK